MEMPLRLTVLLLLLAGAVLAVMAAFAPVDLLLNNEHRMATYVVDILENGGWICPLETPHCARCNRHSRLCRRP